MAKSPETSTAVIGLASYGLLDIWTTHAPKLADLRAAPPGSVAMRQQLLDAELYVGGLAFILGTTYAVLSHDLTALVLMMVVIGATIFWYHQVLDSQEVSHGG